MEAHQPEGETHPTAQPKLRVPGPTLPQQAFARLPPGPSLCDTDVPEAPEVVASKFGGFLVSAGVGLRWPYLVLDLSSPHSGLEENVSHAPHTHLAENGSSTELIGGPRDARERGA